MALALVAVVFAVNAIAIAVALPLVGKPFAGFVVNERLVPGAFGQYHWTGTKAGLKFSDNLVDANQIPLRSVHQLKDLVAKTPVGEAITYTIQRANQLVTVSVPTMVLTPADLIMTFGLFLFSAIAYLIIGSVVFVLKPDTSVSWAFLLLCACLSLFMGTSFDLGTSHWGLKWIYFAATAFIPAAVIHLSLIFPQRVKFVDRHPFAIAVPYMCSAVLAGPLEYFYPGPIFLLCYQIVVGGMFVGAIMLFVSALRPYFWPTSVLGKQRAKVVLLGAALAFPIPAVGTYLSLFGSQWVTLPIETNFLAVPVLFFPASIAYAISKHNLFDVDVYIKRTVGYVIMTSVVAGGYYLLQILVKTTLLDPLLGASSEKVYPFLFVLLTVFAFNPVSQRVQEFVDKLFYRKLFDYKVMVASMSESLTSLVDVQAFIDKLIQTVRTDLFIDRVGVIVLNDRLSAAQTTFRGAKFGHDVEAVGAVPDPCIAPNDPLLMLLAREKTLITKYDVAEDPRYTSVRDVCGQRFEELGASVAFPLFYRDQFAGAIALGYKKSGHFYTREDIDLLKTLSTMTSTAIEQSREKGQKAVLMQLFSKHVSPQVAESLWEQREQFLEGGRPKSQSMVATAMFSDLQGFSTISEKQTPEVLMHWLNTYLDMMTTTVMEHGGVVDDFFGDGVKINFGVPIPRESEAEIRQDAINAVTCALAMEKKMIVLNEKMAAQGQQPLRMRIGIYTGPVVAGSLGSADRMKYTTVGDTVNTAARLESFDKDLVVPRSSGSPCRILIGEPTLRYTEGTFDLEKVGELNLKGKSEKVGAYCVFGWVKDLPMVQEPVM